jgi:predicted metal-dependent HD superfamily phosphohydrolase
MKISESINAQLSRIIVGRQLAQEPSEWLYNAFDALATRAGIATKDRLKLWLDLAMQHNQPHRHYHHLSHLYNILRLIEANESEIHAADSLRWATWFHDYIYIIGNANNEVDSAQVAYNQLSNYLSIDDLLQVQELILATAKHEIPALSEEFSLLQYKDCALFLDFDLAILAAPAPTYSEYKEAVEKEYTSLYAPSDYRIGRAAFMSKFLQRKQLYFSPLFAPAETIARKNISTEIGL